ncbi:MAG: hypothetical protein HC825_00050 [Oscillatoriales cyanobacterium RM1_1_9]|nr:hypothetical protein [Oscillatoriales cyanobacterium RM2_1_1]NJO70523.1 hypothetical protein [Oscillatoriales cyanobacterium RM1_1_9]
MISCIIGYVDHLYKLIYSLGIAPISAQSMSQFMGRALMQQLLQDMVQTLD